MMNEKLKEKPVTELVRALLCLETEEEMLAYLEDVCTVNEILTIAQRHAVASMLREHRTYIEIMEKTGASTATISRVNRSLASGGAGYETVFERLKR